MLESRSTVKMLLFPPIFFTTTSRTTTLWKNLAYWASSWLLTFQMFPFLSCTALCSPQPLLHHPPGELQSSPRQQQQQQQLLLTEVVGASGRIGSQFMRLLQKRAENSNNELYHHQPIAVPRGVCPGSLSASCNQNHMEQKMISCRSLYAHLPPAGNPFTNQHWRIDAVIWSLSAME
jgi:hypothetical protein